MATVEYRQGMLSARPPGGGHGEYVPERSEVHAPSGRRQRPGVIPGAGAPPVCPEVGMYLHPGENFPRLSASSTPFYLAVEKSVKKSDCKVLAA